MNNSPPRTNSAPSQTTSMLASARLYHPVWSLARARQVRHEFKLRHYPLLAFGDQASPVRKSFSSCVKIMGGTTNLLTRDKAKRITVNIAKLPDVVRK